MTTRRIKAARRRAGSKKTPKKAAAARQNLAAANVAKAENTVARAAAALVLRYRQLCREHDPVIAWEVAALSVAGSRQDIRKAARELLSNGVGSQLPDPLTAAVSGKRGRAGSVACVPGSTPGDAAILPDGTATTGTVQPKERG